MISEKSDYIYINYAGGDLSDIEVNADLMPNIELDPYPLRGVDIAFLTEAMNERIVARNANTVAFYGFTSKVGQNMRLCRDAFSPTVPSLHHYLRAGLDPSVVPDAQDFETWYVSEYGEIVIEHTSPYVSHLSKRDVEILFRNQRKLTRLYVKVEHRPDCRVLNRFPTASLSGDYSDDTSQSGGYDLSGKNMGITSDARVPVNYGTQYDIGSGVDALIWRAFGVGDGQINAARDHVFWGWCDYSSIAPASWSYDSGAEIRNVPAGCKVTPIIEFFFSEHIGEGHHGGDTREIISHIQKRGFFPGQQRTAGNRVYNDLSWSWRDMTQNFAPESLPYYRDATSGWRTRPPISSFPLVTQPYYTKRWDVTVTARLDGFLIDMGDRTQWWSD